MTLSLALLRRLALGLPLVARPGAVGLLALGPGCACGPAPCFTRSWEGVLNANQLLRFDVGPPSPDACRVTCEELLALQTDAGPRDAFVSEVDASIEDAGAPRVEAGTGSYSCRREGTALACTFRAVCYGGRAPEGLCTPKVVRGGIAAHFGEMAHLEAAAVPAFEDLAEELMLHGAPRALQRAARQGVGDERRHAAAVGRLARRYGGATPPVVRTERQPRTLMEMAADNAFEGCVREAYGALEAAHQAAHAADPAVRATLQTIAHEEAQHAWLSFELDAWARTKLTAREGRTLTELRHEGVAHLSAELQRERRRSVRVLAGVPSATRAGALVSLLD